MVLLKYNREAAHNTTNTVRHDSYSTSNVQTQNTHNTTRTQNAKQKGEKEKSLAA